MPPLAGLALAAGAFRAVLRKELVDNLRDRRSVAMALVFPLLGPALLAATLNVLPRQQREATERPLALPVVGAEHAPHLVAWLREAGAEILPGPADPEQAVRAGDADVVLVVPPEFGERLRAGRPAPVRLILDESRQAARTAIERARRMLESWSRRTGALRLMARGVHPEAARALAVETHDLSTAQSRAALVLGALPMFLVMAVFMGGMYVAIDATAGERERQSLEPLLLHPVPRPAVALAKIAAAAVFSGAALVETLAAFALLPLAAPADRIGFSLPLGPTFLWRTGVLFLPFVLLAASLLVLVAARARSFKAAQAAMSFLMLAPVLPGVVLALVPLRAEAWMMLVPTLGEQLLVTRLLRGEAVPPLFPVIQMAANAGWTVLLAAAAVRMFRSERSMFGR